MLSFFTTKKIDDYYSIENTRHFFRDKLQNQSSRNNRELISICAIDDQPFAPLTNLNSYGYSIKQLSDIKRIDEVAQYNIILCDIIGVGMYFDKNLQGASIISEIKKEYPEKIVIAYTGAARNKLAAKQAELRADKILTKDTTIEKWIETLDFFIRDTIDPYRIWNKIRIRLIELEISTKDILIIEDAFVRSFEEKDKNFDALKKIISKSDLKSDARSIISSLIGSAIFSAFM